VVAQYVILLAFMAALLISTDTLSKFGISNFWLGLIMAAANGCVVLLAVFVGWQRYTKEQQDLTARSAKLVKIEWACEFSANKFNTTFEFVNAHFVPTSHVLAYYFTSMSNAIDIINRGSIPATKFPAAFHGDDDYGRDSLSLPSSSSSSSSSRSPNGAGGIVVSLRGPQHVVSGDPSLCLQV